MDGSSIEDVVSSSSRLGRLGSPESCRDALSIRNTCPVGVDPAVRCDVDAALGPGRAQGPFDAELIPAGMEVRQIVLDADAVDGRNVDVKLHIRHV